MRKLKDKAMIDGLIDYVNITFPDQYGKLQGLKLNVEHFIEIMENVTDQERCFEYKQNPFKKDIEGKNIDFEESLKLEDALYLRPDISTLRDAPFLKNEAIVFANVYDSINENKIPFAPRNIL